MRRWIEDRNRRALLGLFLAAFLYLGISEVVFPVLEKVKVVSEHAEVSADQLGKFRQALSRKGHYAALFVDTRKRVQNLHARFMDSSNPVIASGELQLMVEKIAKDANINFVQRSIVGTRHQDALVSEVAMTVAFESSPPQLTSFLSSLRSAPKFLQVTAAQISPLQIAHEIPANGELSKNVRATVTIAALFLGSPDSKPDQP